MKDFAMAELCLAVQLEGDLVVVLMPLVWVESYKSKTVWVELAAGLGQQQELNAERIFVPANYWPCSEEVVVLVAAAGALPMALKRSRPFDLLAEEQGHLELLVYLLMMTDHQEGKT